MKTVSLNLYSYDELSKEAKARALRDWNEDNNDDPFLTSHLYNLVKEELDERGIKYAVDTINVLYSLGYSQGDGLMFEGEMTFEGHDVTVEHRGHYYHSYSKTVTWGDFEGESKEGEEEAIAERFESVYHDICKKIERAGYDEIEYQQSEEAFIGACEANEYTFEANGEMRNE
jgi:hypothetical protein